MLVCVVAGSLMPAVTDVPAVLHSVDLPHPAIVPALWFPAELRQSQIVAAPIHQ